MCKRDVVGPVRPSLFFLQKGNFILTLHSSSLVSRPTAVLRRYRPRERELGAPATHGQEPPGPPLPLGWAARRHGGALRAAGNFRPGGGGGGLRWAVLQAGRQAGRQAPDGEFLERDGDRCRGVKHHLPSPQLLSLSGKRPSEPGGRRRRTGAAGRRSPIRSLSSLTPVLPRPSPSGCCGGKPSDSAPVLQTLFCL